MNFPDYTYEHMRRISYDGWQFIPVCPKCGKFVKADPTIMVNGLGDYEKVPNATCKKCGRIEMPSEGWI